MNHETRPESALEEEATFFENNESSVHDAVDDAADDAAFNDDWGDPPATSRKRPLWMALLAMLVCLYLLFSLRHDLVYAFTTGEPVDLGDAVGFASTDLPDGTLVAISGIRNPTRGIHLNAAINDRNVFQMMGAPKVFIETVADADKGQDRLTSERFVGRLRNFADVPYYNVVREFAAFNYGIDIQEGAILVQASEKPEDFWYIPILAGLLALIALVNAYLVTRRLWPARS